MQITGVDLQSRAISFSPSTVYAHFFAQVTHAGRDEVDLMRVEIHSPIPTPPAGSTMTLRLLNGAARFWTDSLKNTELPTTWNFDIADIPIGGTLSVWIEATDESRDLRDIVIELECDGVKDIVRATGIWATRTGVAHDSNDVFGNGTAWEDMNDGPLTALQALGGAGLRPVDASIGVHNAIFTQYTVGPFRDQTLDGSWSSDGVTFDATRTKEGRDWVDTGSGFVVENSAQFPIVSELPSDDAVGLGDHSNAPTSSGHYYYFDSPGLAAATPPAWIGFAYEKNFRDWIRVGVGNSIVDVGNDVAGSRSSAYFEWHASHNLILQGSAWERTTGDVPEVPNLNDIGPGRRTIGDLP